MSTELRFDIPVSLDLDPAIAPAVPLRASFVLRGFRVYVTLAARTGEGGPFDPAFVAVTCHVSAFAESEADINATANDPAALLTFVARCTNRILAALRNAGLMHSARTLPQGWGTSDPAAALHSLNLVRRASREAPWTPQYVPDTFESILLSRLQSERQRWPSGTLMISRLSDVERSIESGAPPSPEDEFYVNALEHLHNGNLRVAVIESVICLELCVAGWMRLWLTQRGVAEEDVAAYFSKDVGIAARVAVMVPLMRHHSRWIAPFDKAAVLSLIRCRNAIAHKTGRLEGISEDELRRLIMEAMKLAFNAARESDNIRLQPAFRDMANGLTTLIGRPVRLEVWGARLFFVWCEYSLFESFPPEAAVRTLIDKVTQHLRECDRWFDRDDQLHLHINQGNRTIVYFVEGKLEYAAEPLAPQSLLATSRAATALSDDHRAPDASLSTAAGDGARQAE